MKIRNFTLILASMVLLQLSGCAYNVRSTNQYMTIKDSERGSYPSKGNALLIVERIEELSLSAYNMVVWDVTDRMNPDLIGYLAPTMKAAYEMEPGEHTILVQMVASNNIMD